MKLYQWIMYDTEYETFTIITEKTKLEADLKAWAFITNIGLDTKAEDVYEVEECAVDTFYKFCNSESCYFPFQGGYLLDCKRNSIEL